MNTKTDLRVQKTYKALFKALQELLSEKNFDEITVTELCERAETRKATFYKHFSDKSDLFVFMVQSLQEQYEEIHNRSYKDGDKFAFYSGIVSYTLDFLEEHELMAQKVLNSKSKWQLLDLISGQIESDLQYHLHKDSKTKADGFSPDYLASLLTGALVEGVCYWLTNKNKLSKEEATNQILELIRRVYR